MTSLWGKTSEKTEEEKEFPIREYDKNLDDTYNKPAKQKIKKYLKKNKLKISEYQVERREVWNKTQYWPPGVYEPPNIPWRRWKRVRNKKVGVYFIINLHMTRTLKFTYRTIIQNGKEYINYKGERFIQIPSKLGRYIDLD